MAAEEMPNVIPPIAKKPMRKIIRSRPAEIPSEFPIPDSTPPNIFD